MSRILAMQQTPVYWVKWLIIISKWLIYARKCKNLGNMGFLGIFESIAGRTIRLEHHTMSQILQVQQTPVFWCNMHITISKYLKFARK